MTDTNPPKERETAPGNDPEQELRHFGRAILRARHNENVCEAVGAETARILEREETDPNRRAAFWLIGRGLIMSDYDDGSPTGARAMSQWVRMMLGAHSQP